MNGVRNLLNRTVKGLEYLGRHLVLSFVLIFCISATIRTGLLMGLPNGQIELQSETERIGFSIAEHGTFADPYLIPTGVTAHSPPFYPAVVAGIYRAFGAGYAGNLVRCGLLIAMYSLLYGVYPLLARALDLPVVAGVLGGLFSALLPLKRSAEVWKGWEEPYAALATAGLLVLTLRVWKARTLSFTTAALYGVGWGLTFYLAPALAPVLVALCMVHVIRYSERHRLRALQWWGIVLAAVIVVVLPWTLRNHQQFGKWMFMRDNLGLELYVSNQDQAQASIEINQVMLRQAHPSYSEHAAERLRDMGEIAYNHDLLNSAISWIAGHPVHFLELTATRTAYFWMGSWEHPEIVASGLLAIFAFAGLAMIARSDGSEKTWLIATVWLVYPAIYYVVQYVNRYRMPIEWTITLPAGVFAYHCLKAAARSTSTSGDLAAQAPAISSNVSSQC